MVIVGMPQEGPYALFEIDRHCGLRHQLLEAIEDGPELLAVHSANGFLEQFVGLLAQDSCHQIGASPTQALAQRSQQMKVAQLKNPAIFIRDGATSVELVPDESPDGLALFSRDCRQRILPCLHPFRAFDKNRINERGGFGVHRPERHEVKHPRGAFESEPEAIDQKNRILRCDRNDPRPKQVGLKRLGEPAA